MNIFDQYLDKIKKILLDLSKNGDWATWRVKLDPHLESGNSTVYARLKVSDDSIHQVDFLGEQQPDALLEHMRRAHVMAIPSAYEGFGMAYLEGLSAGLPAIATTKGAPPEFITHGCNGFLVPPNSPSHVAEHIQALARDRTLLTQFGLNARESFESHPTWDESFKGARDFILQISAERSPTHANSATPGKTVQQS